METCPSGLVRGDELKSLRKDFVGVLERKTLKNNVFALLNSTQALIFI